MTTTNATEQTTPAANETQKSTRTRKPRASSAKTTKGKTSTKSTGTTKKGKSTTSEKSTGKKTVNPNRAKIAARWKAGATIADLVKEFKMTRPAIRRAIAAEVGGKDSFKALRAKGAGGNAKTGPKPKTEKGAAKGRSAKSTGKAAGKSTRKQKSSAEPIANPGTRAERRQAEIEAAKAA